nr:MAG TPA: hypothetical protein [Caudoviricetes sp.]
MFNEYKLITPPLIPAENQPLNFSIMIKKPVLS